jgi:hypothetical protein
MKTKIALMLSLALFALPAFAQRAARLVDTYDSCWSPASNESWSLDSSGEMIYIRHSGGSGRSVSSLTCPGGVAAYSAGHALLCGKDSAGAGSVQAWLSSGSGAIFLSSARSDQGRDYVGVAFDAISSRLYLLDAIGQQVLCGVWDGQGPLASVVLSVALTASDLSLTGSAAEYTLDLPPVGELRLVSYPRVYGQEGFILNLLGASPSVVPLGPPEERRGGYLVPELSSEGGYVVSVRAALGAPFEVVRASSGAVIGSGVGLGGDVVTEIPVSEALVLGERYSLRVPSIPSLNDYSFECVRRYGQSDTLSDGTQMTPFFYQMGAVSGSLFNVQLALRSAPTSFDRSYSAYLLVAFRFPYDPVVQVGTSILLDAPVIVPATGWIPASMQDGRVSVDVPIPGGFEGLVFLVQYLVLDGAEWKFSQIYGSAIK